MHLLFALVCSCISFISVQCVPIDQFVFANDDGTGDELAWFTPEPVGMPCYHNPGTYDRRKCQVVKDSLRIDKWISDQPGYHFYANWASCQAAGQTCALPLNGTTVDISEKATCFTGSVPEKILKLDGQSASARDNQIFKAMDLAKRDEVSLVIRNTGHDWKGRSSGPGAYALWTHSLKGISFDTSFRPEGCDDTRSPEEVFHYDAGVAWGEAYKFAEDHDRAILGGTCGSVGIAGWLQGGGHSPLTPVYGMGVDNVRQLEVIVPNGSEGKPEKLVVNECQKSELFFALRGGGAGTFGVITKISYKALPKFPVQVLNAWKKDGKLSDEAVEYWFDLVTSSAPNWKSRGWGGYMKPGSYGSIQGGAYMQVSTPKSSLVDAKEDMKNMTAFLKANNYSCEVSTCEPKSYASWYEFFYYNLQPPNTHPGGASAAVGSQLLGLEAFSGLRRIELVKTLIGLYKKNIHVLLMGVTPTALSHDATSALHPSWSDAVMSVRVNDLWDQYFEGNTADSISAKFRAVNSAVQDLRRHSPDMGASISEADIWESDSAAVFWGSENAKCLNEIKGKYDPKSILTNWGAVNFDPKDERYRCYPK